MTRTPKEKPPQPPATRRKPAEKSASKRHKAVNMTDRTHIKAAAIAALLIGQGVLETAREFNIPQSTLSTWLAKLPKEKRDEIRLKQGERIENLIGEYMAVGLQALIAQAQVASDPAYLRTQTGESLAVLHGVMSDKIVRVIEASQPRMPALPDYDDEPQDTEPRETKLIESSAKVSK